MKLFNIKLQLLVLFSSLTLACNKEFPDPEKKVTINVITQSTTLPGEVSMFFQVYDKKNSTPLAGLQSNDFLIYEQGPNDDKYNKISASEANSSIVLDNQYFIFNTMLVLDLSASVTSGSLSELKSSAVTFIDEFLPSEVSNNTRMGVWWFDGKDTLHMLRDYTEYRDSLILAVNSISSTISSDPSTNLYGAVVRSVATSKANSDLYTNQNILNSSAIVIFTDGTDQAAWNTLESATNSIAQVSNNTKFLTIGLGDEIDKDVLRKIGTSGFASAKRPDKLNETFSKIAKRIFNEANSYYLFKYCSPKRNGSNIQLKLEIDAKVNKQKHKGEIETSFDATGFTGC